jgi:DNA replicative helicase MCM subunit Mcm2 (Cdc46/Mcm family)
METPNIDNIISLGADQNLAQGIFTAISNYDYIDISRFNGMLKDALKHLLPDDQDLDFKEPKVEDEQQEDDSEGNIEYEEKFLEIIEELDSDVKGAAWEDIMALAQKKGLSRIQIEETTNSLLDKGLIYEPVLGRIKKI